MIAILLIAVAVVIVYILKYDDWYPNGKDDTTVEEELLQLPSDGNKKVVDGDTIDVVIDLGFDIYKHERVRVAGIDTPEKRTRDLEEKALGIDATNWMKGTLEDTIKGDDELTIRTELKGGVGKYGRLLGWLYVGDAEVSLNEQMIEEGYAWDYDGGTKRKDFASLRAIREANGTIDVEPSEGDPLPEVGDGLQSTTAANLPGLY